MAVSCLILAALELVLYQCTLSIDVLKPSPLRGVSLSSYSRFKTGDNVQARALSPTSERPIIIVVIQSNPDHYWCSCAKRSVISYVESHDFYELKWITLDDDDEEGGAVNKDPKAAKS